MERGGYVYIMSNKNNTVLYIGVSSNLMARVFEHQTKISPTCFTARYNCDKLVFFEPFDFIEDAIAREKQLKGGNRAVKVELVNSINPSWKDLFEDINENDF